MARPANRPLLAATLALLALAASPVQAQYKSVGPDGTVTFSDRMPDANKGRVSNVTTRGSDASAAELPYELRGVVQKYPVTIYTSNDCDPCRQGLELLKRRGIPFQERTATKEEDRALWQQTTGTSEAPVLVIGKQQLKAFDATAWNDTLDAAGYPATSKLPTNYRHAEAKPLAPKAPPPQMTQVAPKPAPEVAASPTGTGGIRF